MPKSGKHIFVLYESGREPDQSKHCKSTVYQGKKKGRSADICLSLEVVEDEKGVHRIQLTVWITPFNSSEAVNEGVRALVAVPLDAKSPKTGELNVYCVASTETQLALILELVESIGNLSLDEQQEQEQERISSVPAVAKFDANKPQTDELNEQSSVAAIETQLDLIFGRVESDVDVSLHEQQRLAKEKKQLEQELELLQQEVKLEEQPQPQLQLDLGAEAELVSANVAQTSKKKVKVPCEILDESPASAETGKSDSDYIENLGHKQKEAERLLQLQRLDIIRNVQEQTRLSQQRNWQTEKEEEKAARRLAALRQDFDHQIRVQLKSAAKLREKQELQDKLREREERARRETVKQQKLLNEQRLIEEVEAAKKRRREQADREHRQQLERFETYQLLHLEASNSNCSFGFPDHPYPHQEGCSYNSFSSLSTLSTSTTISTESFFGSSLMQNEMVSIPMANLNGGLKAASGSAVGSSTGGGVRYFSQFSKGGVSSSSSSSSSTTTTTTTLVHQHLQHQQRSNGELYANGRLGLMRIKTEQHEFLMDSLTAIKPELINETKHKAAQAPAPAPAAAAAVEATAAESQPAAEAEDAPMGPQEASGDDPELDIVINNVVCSFSVRCHLKLRDIALRGKNVEYRRENGMVTMKLRRPYTTASIWSSGRITCTGATSEVMAKVAARRYARCLGKLGFPTRFQNFRIVNVLGTCSMPWAIKIVNFSKKHRKNASYEPELHPGVTYKMKMPKATLKIFSTGSVTVTAACVNDVESAIQHIYPLVHEFSKQRSSEELQHLRAKQNKNAGISGKVAGAKAASIASTITNASETRKLHDEILTIAKVQSRSDILVNATAAHAKTTPRHAAEDLANAPVCNWQRLKQIESYCHLSMQTQEERRHIPFPRDKSESGLFPHSNPKTPPRENICANARRRATECWATKLLHKRPRYNDPRPVSAGKPTTMQTSDITSSTSSTSSTSNPASQSTTNSTPATGTAPILPLSSLTPIGSISGSRPFSMIGSRTIVPDAGAIIQIKQSCIKPLNRNALTAFTAASSGGNISATATGTGTGNSSLRAAPAPAATIKRKQQ
ncbi:uncharacterized protein LOC117590977 [Drosophila guanche]|uniref:uncharacterized protein LOC117590977 n=1 Tax=Drosophila guanche TaxID=7266 RepID=UPI001471C1D1|nr:uncharacterized protein LOC117590977 [Drosophila guanche]